MQPFRPVRARVLSVITLALTAGMMSQASAYAGTVSTTSPATPRLASTISKVSSANGVETGGSVVTITGSNFVGVTSVAFGSKPATQFNAVSQTSISAVTPALPPGKYRVAVTTAAGTTVAARYTVRTFEAEVLRLINEARATSRKCGSSSYKAAAPLRWDSRLAKVATRHSEDMAANAFFSHDSQNGRSPFDRMKRAGYRYDSAGENIAAGFRTPDSVVRAWLNSPGHCKNVMRRNYTELGVGYATGGVYGSYWTQDFGNPR